MMTQLLLQYLGLPAKSVNWELKNATELEYKYLEDDLPLLDSDGVHWGKCDAYGSCGH